MSLKCWRCQACFDPWGWCSNCDLKGIRAAATRVVLPAGTKLTGVILRTSGNRLDPEAAKAAKVIYVEKAGNDLHVYPLHCLDVLVEAEKPQTSNHQPGQAIPPFIKGK
jgi:hypothetical protein